MLEEVNLNATTPGCAANTYATRVPIVVGRRLGNCELPHIVANIEKIHVIHHLGTVQPTLP
jgi:hypothetical protein